MIQCKFDRELDRALACNSLTHDMGEKVLHKKQKLPIQPKIGARPIINIKLNWEENPKSILGLYSTQEPIYQYSYNY